MISEIEENMFDISKLALNSQQRLSAHLTVHYKVFFLEPTMTREKTKYHQKLQLRHGLGKEMAPDEKI